MVELVDTRDLGSRALGRAGSTPVPGTSPPINHDGEKLRQKFAEFGIEEDQIDSVF
jgi:hypothetical protein